MVAPQMMEEFPPDARKRMPDDVSKTGRATEEQSKEFHHCFGPACGGIFGSVQSQDLNSRLGGATIVFSLQACICTTATTVAIQHYCPWEHYRRMGMAVQHLYIDYVTQGKLNSHQMTCNETVLTPEHQKQQTCYITEHAITKHANITNILRHSL